MKNKQTKLRLNKFKIAKLNNSKSIVGGSVGCGGDGTDRTGDDDDGCVTTSDIIIDTN